MIVDGGFRLTERPGRLVAERGLVGRRSVTIDRSRVRALEVRDSPPWRALDLAALRAVVGGVSSGQGDARGRTTLLPAGPARRGLARSRARSTRTAHDGLDPHPRAALQRRRLVPGGRRARRRRRRAAVVGPWQARRRARGRRRPDGPRRASTATARSATASSAAAWACARAACRGATRSSSRRASSPTASRRAPSSAAPACARSRPSSARAPARAARSTSRRRRAAALLERLEPELVAPLLAGGTRHEEQ